MSQHLTKLGEAIKNSLYTAVVVSKECNIPISTLNAHRYSNLKNSYATPNPDIINKVAEFLKIEPEELI